MRLCKSLTGYLVQEPEQADQTQQSPFNHKEAIVEYPHASSELVEKAIEYALTGEIFSEDCKAINGAVDALRFAEELARVVYCIVEAVDD